MQPFKRNLPPKYTPFIKQFGKFWLPRMDLYNGGYKDPATGRPKSFYSSRYISQILSGHNYDEEKRRPLFLSKLTKTDLTHHHEGRRTIYYRSSRKTPVPTFMLDFDAHAGQLDAWEAWNWFSSIYMQNVYAEPSTGGRGVHPFVHIHVEFFKREKVNERLKLLAKSIDRLLYREGFGTNCCCIAGTYTILTKPPEGGVRILKGNRGRLGKIPRLPNGEDDLNRLIHSPVYEFVDLAQIVIDARGLPDRPKPKKGAESQSEGKTAAVVISQDDPFKEEDENDEDEEEDLRNRTCNSERRKAGEVNLAEDWGSKEQPAGEERRTTKTLKVISVSVLQRLEQWRENPKLADLYEKAKITKNPLSRMRQASSLYRHVHGYYAVDELTLVKWYEDLLLNTGEPKRFIRHERAKLALDKHRATERPSKKGFDPNDWLPLIRHHVTAEVQGNALVKYPYRIEDELLAACLYLLTTNAFAKNRTDRLHSCSDTGQVAFYKKLADEGVLVSENKPIRFSNKNKRNAVIDLLQLAGLLVLRDGNFRYGGPKNGFGNKYGPGVHHPRHAEFVDLYGHVVDQRSVPVMQKTREKVA